MSTLHAQVSTGRGERAVCELPTTTIKSLYTQVARCFLIVVTDGRQGSRLLDNIASYGQADIVTSSSKTVPSERYVVYQKLSGSQEVVHGRPQLLRRGA